MSYKEVIPREQVLELAGHKVEGVSIGGLETCLVLPAYKVVFDVGRCTQRAATMGSTVLLTHTHMDHCSGVASLAATRRLLGLSPPVIYAPTSKVDSLRKYIDAASQLDETEILCELKGIEPGDEVQLSPGLFARAFKTVHTVVSQGYTLFTRKLKLKKEFLGLPGKEIKALKEQGVNVSDTHEIQEVSFVGDSTPRWLDGTDDEHVKAALNSRLLIMECTFIDSTVTSDQATLRGHTHIDHIAGNRAMFRNTEMILLNHFSARYTANEVYEHLQRKLPQDLNAKVTPLLHGFPRGREIQ